tara:strand:+ start:3245 stop:4177 length:933 start_codon:yes stop_codon:yes gene_type:complete
MRIAKEKVDLQKTFIAIVAMLAGVVCVDLYLVVIRYIGDDYSVFKLAVFRNFFAIIPLLVLLFISKEYNSLFKNINKKFLSLCCMRGLCFLAMNIFIFLSVINVEFATAMTLTFSSPFFIVILSIIFLQDKVGIFRWSAIIIGFVGVVLILRPTSDIFNFYSTYSILTAFAWGVTVIILKFIPKNFSTSKIQFYTLVFNVIGAFSLFVLFSNDFYVNNYKDLFLMVLTGILGGTAAILFIYAYRLISLSKLASFEYFGIPSSFLLGWIFFNEAPWEQLFPGVLLIVFAGFIIIWRDAEKSKSLKANKQIY